MSQRDRALFIDSLGNNWNQSTSVAGALIALNQPPGPAATPPKSRTHLSQIGWSIKNMAAAATTCAVQVRDSTAAGTVLAQWNIVTANAASKEDCFNINIQGLRGNQLWIGTDTAVASVTVAISAAGWTDTLGDG